MELYRYDAFISYRHTEPDRGWAKWLHASLERFKTPRELVLHKRLPARISRVFRDEDELPASADLSSEIEDALEAARFLIVVCSPRTPESAWIDKEVERFRELGRDDRILALLIEGEPAESFPRALREIRKEVTDEAGSRHDVIEEVEPLAADVRSIRRERPATLKRLALLRMLACILGCRFDDLRQRHSEQRRRRLTLTAALVATILLVLVGTTIFGIYQAVRRAESDAYAALARERERHQLENATQATAASTYLLMLRTEGNRVVPSATAWVVAPHTLVTAAYVAESAVERRHPIVLRSTADTPLDFEVEHSTLHPGYARFRELMGRFEVPVSTFMNPCDVALLRVPESVKGLAPPLPVATRDSLLTIRPGMEVAFVGFPIESRIGGANALRPLALSTRGSVLSVSDAFLGRTPFEAARLLGFVGTIAGGASGSPVVRSTGEVIGQLTGGDFAVARDGSRIPLGTAYGPRADTIRELLDGTAKDQVADRAEAWERFMRHYFRANRATLLQGAIQRRVGSVPVALSRTRKYETDRELEFTVAAGGWVLVVLTDGTEVRVDQLSTDGWEQAYEGCLIVIPLQIPATRRVPLRVRSDPLGAEFETRLYRVGR